MTTMTVTWVVIGILITFFVGIAVCVCFFILSKIYLNRRLKGEGKVCKLPQPLTIIIAIVLFISIISVSFIIWGVASSRNNNIFKNEYNAVLSEGYALENYTNELHFIKNKAQLDVIYSKYVKEDYAETTGRDFDDDYPYGSIDFEKRMLVISFDLRPYYGEVYALKNITVEKNYYGNKVLQITYTNTKELVGEAFQLRCIVIEIDRLDADYLTLTKI